MIKEKMNIGLYNFPKIIYRYIYEFIIYFCKSASVFSFLLLPFTILNTKQPCNTH